MSPTPSDPKPVADVKTVAVKVDGRQVEVPQMTPHPVSGDLLPTTMIQACEAAKVKVPHYCYHHKLPVAGNCRMCLVEYGKPALGPDRQPLLNPDGTVRIEKAPVPAIACATPIAPGMEIYTNTPAVQAMRRGILEFLLINHPLDCPICDQAGECKLQEYSMEYGQTQSQFAEAKLHKPKQVDLGPRIVLDDERCILCSRCIRFTREIVKDDALGFINRGGHTTLANYPGRQFDNDYTLNTVDICPVGALTSKDFRFQMRVWFLKETNSICPSCGTGCNITISSRENKIYRFVPRQNDNVNSCWMCDDGRLNYKWIGRSDRLCEVKIREPDGQSAISAWTEALEEIAARLTNIAPGAAAIIASARQTNEELFLIAKLAKKLGALTDSIPRMGQGDDLLVNADKNPNSQGARIVGVAANPAGSLLHKIAKGIHNDSIKTLIVLGEDVTTHGFNAKLLGNLDALVVSNVLPDKTTKLAHYLLPGAAFAEKNGTFTNANGRVQKFSKATDAPGEAKPELEFLRELTVRVTGESLPATAAELFDQMALELPALNGMSWASLGDNGLSINE